KSGYCGRDSANVPRKGVRKRYHPGHSPPSRLSVGAGVSGGFSAVLTGSGDGPAASDDRPAPDRVDFDPAYDPSAPIEYEVCGGEMRYIAACKILCGNCGYRRDCSDP